MGLKPRNLEEFAVLTLSILGLWFATVLVLSLTIMIIVWTVGWFK